MSLLLDRPPGKSSRLPEPLRLLRSRLRSFSPGPELLYDLMGFGPFLEMAMTRDGQLIARPRRSAGFDAFVGHPSTAVVERTGRLWLELDPEQRMLVLDRLLAQNIDPVRVGIPRLPFPPHSHRPSERANGR
jgi:hypothetical protein